VKKHVVAQGECILSIAASEGLGWQRLWNHPENEELRRRRKDPNILLAGDVVAIPDRRVRVFTCETGASHRLVLRRPMAEIRVRLHRHGSPRKAEPYHVEIDGRRYDGEAPSTDESGLVVCKVPASATVATVVVGNDDRFVLLLGHLDPPDTVTGMHGMLENIGFDAGGVASPWDEVSANALAECLTTHGVEDGMQGDHADHADPQNRSALLHAYRT
jgi:hypothetical protein